jgi:hypothetical protein
MVSSNLTADTPSVYRPYAVYDRSAGERRALHLVRMDWLVAQEQEKRSQWTYHALATVNRWFLSVGLETSS